MKKWIAGLTFVLIAWAALALGQTVVQDGQKSYTMQGSYIAGVKRGDTTGVIINGTSGGALSVSDESRDRDNWTTYSLAINDTMTVGAGLSSLSNMGAAYQAESTSVMPMGAYRRVALFMRAIPAAGDTSTLIRFAVQVRGHLTQTADTTNTFVWHRFNVAPATGSAIDTLGQYVASPYSGGGFNVANSGEFIVEFSPKMGLATGTSQANGGPRGIMIPLIGVRGEQFWAPYISVRVRCLTGASKPRLHLSLAMGS